MDLTAFDTILISTSGGKDSQTVLRETVRQADLQGVSRDRLVAVHADLGRVEWAGTRDLAARQVAAYGIRFEVVQRDRGDLLDQIELRGKFPDHKRRYCTSDQKRDQIIKLITRLHREWKAVRPRTSTIFRLLSVTGIRAQESTARAAKQASGRNSKASTQGREVTDWLPILDWTEDQVWADIKASGIEHAEAYDLGMPRLSCVFCVFAPKAALMIAAKHNPELLAEYVRVEDKIGHSFTERMSIRSIQEAVAN